MASTDGRLYDILGCRFSTWVECGTDYAGGGCGVGGGESAEIVLATFKSGDLWPRRNRKGSLLKGGATGRRAWRARYNLPQQERTRRGRAGERPHKGGR